MSLLPYWIVLAWSLLRPLPSSMFWTSQLARPCAWKANFFGGFYLSRSKPDHWFVVLASSLETVIQPSFYLVHHDTKDCRNYQHIRRTVFAKKWLQKCWEQIQGFLFVRFSTKVSQKGGCIFYLGNCGKLREAFENVKSGWDITFTEHFVCRRVPWRLWSSSAACWPRYSTASCNTVPVLESSWGNSTSPSNSSQSWTMFHRSSKRWGREEKSFFPSSMSLMRICECLLFCV